MKKKIIIIGAGPAGLTAAYELSNNNFDVVVIEKTSDIGGISKTVQYKGNRIDIGGHRFFSKSDVVMQWWNNILPVEKVEDDQVEISYQGKKRQLNVLGGVDSTQTDKVMLIRNRLSRILFLKKFFKYPLSLSLETVKNLGLWRIVKIGTSYVKAILFPIKNEKNLEEFFINRFGKELYLTFFRDYTEKVWGAKCSEIPADWGAQRIKGLSIYKAIKSMLLAPFLKKDVDQKKVETSLIERFLYPKHGPGQMWEEVARIVKERGVQILMNTWVEEIIIDEDNVRRVVITNREGQKNELECDYFISTMPIRELVSLFVPEIKGDIRSISDNLVYRDFITVGVLMDKMDEEFAPGGVAPDNWIYIQESHVKVGRLQIFNNWSPYLLDDPNKVWVGMEYFCNEGDDFWNKTDVDIKNFAFSEIVELGITKSSYISDGVVIRMEKAYPAYFGSYAKFDTLRSYLDNVKNLFLVGRNGMHRYNNQDHSMLTAIEAANQIKTGRLDKSAIWAINTEQEYHEKK